MATESDLISNIIDLAQQLSVQQRSVDILKATYQQALDARDKLHSQLADTHDKLSNLIDGNTTTVQVTPPAPTTNVKG